MFLRASEEFLVSYLGGLRKSARSQPYGRMCKRTTKTLTLSSDTTAKVNTVYIKSGHPRAKPWSSQSFSKHSMMFEATVWNCHPISTSASSSSFLKCRDPPGQRSTANLARSASWPDTAQRRGRPVDHIGGICPISRGSVRSTNAISDPLISQELGFGKGTAECN